MNICMRKLINEQFNISNMDLNNKSNKKNGNIFNKNIIDIKRIYYKIVNIDYDDITEDEI